jgi:hypothetical protein
MKKLSMLTAFSFSALTAACNNGTVGLQFQAVTGDGSAASSGDVVTDDAQTTFSLVDAQLHLRDIELDLPEGSTCSDVPETAGTKCDESSNKIVIDGPFVIDLVTGQSTPDLSTIEVPAGVYKRIDFRVEDGDPSEGVVAEGSALDNRSFAGSFTFDDQGTPLTLRLSLRFNEDIRIEDPAGIDATGSAQALLTTFDISAWFAGLDISGCLENGDLRIVDGEVLVDDDALSGSGDCSDIENTLKTNMKNSGQIDKQ